MHAHPAPADWKYGMDADADVLPRGTTTMLSQGDAGAAVWDAYYEDIVAPARARILMAISPAVQGESEHRTVFGRLDDVDPDACASRPSSAAAPTSGAYRSTHRPHAPAIPTPER